MTPQELDLCRQTLHTLTSSKDLSNKNYLFLEPVDLSYFPTYTQYVQRPMDLGTIAACLSGAHNYKTVDDVFTDVMLCFENAIVFHSDKPENQWIVKLAKDMIRVTQRERKKVQKILDLNTTATATAAVTMNMSTVAETKDMQERPSVISNHKTSTTSSADGSKANKLTRQQSKVKLTLSLSKTQVKNTSTSDVQDTINMTSTTTSATSVEVLTSPSSSVSNSRGKQLPHLQMEKNSKSSSTKTTTNTTKTPKIRLSLGNNKSTTTITNTISTTSSIADAIHDESLVVSQTKSLMDSNPSTTTILANSISNVSTKSMQPTSKNKLKKLPLHMKSAFPTTTIATSSVTTSAAVTTNHVSKPEASEDGSGVGNIEKTLVSSSIAPTPKQSLTMTTKQKAQCCKFLSALIRRNYDNAYWFLKPVNEPGLIEDYKSKIPNPMDLGTINTKLNKNQYATVAEFVLDVRRVFGNCLRYNADVTNTFRTVAREMIISTEKLLSFFLADEMDSGKKASSPSLYPPLLYCWKQLLDLLDYLLALKSPDGHMTIYYFLHPPSFYFGGVYPTAYREKVITPMDFGSITSRLVEGNYASLDHFVYDCKLVPENCLTYYSDIDEKGGTVESIIKDQAKKLGQVLSVKLDALIKKDRSIGSNKARLITAEESSKFIDIIKPTQSVLKTIMKELREVSYTDKLTKLSEKAMVHFEEPVNTALFPDYRNYVIMPMDLKTIDRKIENDSYRTPEDFEYDVNLIFKNCEAYNIPKKNSHIVTLAKYCMKAFNKVYSSHVKSWEASACNRLTSEEERKRLVSSAVDSISEKGPLTKKAKLDQGPRTSTGPRASLITIPTESKAPVARENIPRIVIKMDGPVPMHIAIAQIKDSFSIRRLHKDLDSWEGACSRYYRELMRHPWLSASRPKFIFHCPVTILFPELKEAYAAKISRPMDLTTIESKLLQGGIYKCPQELVDDVALVFSNAMSFNKTGHDEGEPLSSAYFDASTHLLKYARWLSLDLLDQYLIDDSVQNEPTLMQQGPIHSWKLSASYHKAAKDEMEAFVYKQTIEKSTEGDRFTWMESECEKLLKSLRHQSDLKFMTYFLQPNYPTDYFAYVSKPMDWETCQRMLQQRKYDTFGSIVEHLRLIFSNALKYNGRAKGTDTVSGRAYDAAVYMSSKLESAIDRMLLAVSDRIEREKIDLTIAERESQAAERAEAERLRREWQKERDRIHSVSVGGGNVSDCRINRIMMDRANSNKSTSDKRLLDVEIPMYEEDTAHQDQDQAKVVNQQRIMYEKQLSDCVRMLQAMKELGDKVYFNLLERSRAISWAKTLADKIIQTASPTETVPQTANLPEAGATTNIIRGTALESVNQSVRFSLPINSKVYKRKVKTNIWV